MEDNNKNIICEHCGQKFIEFGMHFCYDHKNYYNNLQNINDIIEILEQDKYKIINNEELYDIYLIMINRAECIKKIYQDFLNKINK
jgi:hypothetical protein